MPYGYGSANQGSSSTTSSSSGNGGGWSPGVQHSGMPTSTPSTGDGSYTDEEAKAL